MMPLDFPTDRAVIEAALPTLGMVAPANVKLVWIRNTLDLREVECSAAYLELARERQDLEILTSPRELPFDAAGNLPADGVRALAAR